MLKCLIVIKTPWRQFRMIELPQGLRRTACPRVSSINSYWISKITLYYHRLIVPLTSALLSVKNVLRFKSKSYWTATLVIRSKRVANTSKAPCGQVLTQKSIWALSQRSTTTFLNDSTSEKTSKCQSKTTGILITPSQPITTRPFFGTSIIIQGIRWTQDSPAKKNL